MAITIGFARGCLPCVVPYRATGLSSRRPSWSRLKRLPGKGPFRTSCGNGPTLVLLLSQQSLVSNSEAAQRVQFHPRSVRRWRHCWATGDFSLDDKPGRGGKADFSPSGPRTGQGGRL